ncbi:hypothetical protein HKI87_02g17410 [Chloropicon roscoffensis]|uniref:Tetraspanin n=1 Tax=Chloropicon roscoffensis TaxID=1461544 RepID=A0AAX4P2S5_9CHLO
MVCCIDKVVCEWLLRIGNALAAVAGLFLLACGLYLEFGGVESESKLLEFLKLQDIQQVYTVVARFPIWMMVVGSVIATFCIVAVFCTGASCSKCWYCFYSPVLLLCSVAIIFGVVVLNLSARTIESSDGQVIEILGYNLNGQLEVLWAKGILDDRETLCQLQEVVGCSGFYNEQCRVPPTGDFSQAQVVAGCPAQAELFNATGSLQTPATVTNETLSEISSAAGYNVGKCLYYETENVALGCLSTFAEILYQLGNTLFIPGLVIGSYCLALSLISSYLTCCTLCGKM